MNVTRGKREQAEDERADGRGPSVMPERFAPTRVAMLSNLTEGWYELRLDTNEDYVEDVTWRFTSPVDSAGTQHVQLAELTGREATDRDAKGRIGVG